ncbi:hypothetical protein HZA38_04490 [Candidatus Peregrinibacteria bacterium]|nr:hypothetical protein [Candidatus Peregrinibacteria bacterium]
MKIGLLYEGDFDEKPLQIIIQRIIGEINPNIRNIEFILKPAHGSINKQVGIAFSLFYSVHNCDMAVFIADSDGKRDKQKKIKTQVTKHCIKIKPDSRNIVGCPDPELEQWFLDEENAIKIIFSLEREDALPYPEMSPKERFRRIITENNSDITTTLSDIYVKSAEIMDFKKLEMSSKSFENFYGSFCKISKVIKHM